MIPETRILITKFPFKASLSGVEKHTFSLVKNLEGKGVRFFLLASCPVMLSEFKKQGWPNQRWWLGLAPETRGSKVTFLFSWPLLVLSSLIGLVYCRYKFKIEKLYCLGLTDKLIMTPVALLLGYKVIWPEALSIDPTLSNNIYRFLYKWWSSKVDVVAISHFVKQELENLGVKDVIVIRHGVEPTIFKKQEDLFEMMAEKRSVNYEKRNFTVGCVARLDEIKGLEYLIKAVDILKDNFMGSFVQFPEQYFDVQLIKQQIPDNYITEDIHYIEWYIFQGKLNALDYNPKDNSVGYKNQLRRLLLERSLQTYLRKTDCSEKDFLEHLLALLNQHTVRLTPEAKAIVDQWLANRIVLVNAKRTIKNKEIKPSEFANENWRRIKQLVLQTDGNIAAAARQICSEAVNHPDNIKSLTRAISRLCKTRGVPHNKNK